MMQPPTPEPVAARSSARTIVDAWPYAVVALLLAAAIWFLYSQLTGVRGVKMEAPSPQVVSMLPPPPPPEPQPQPKPPAPTEQPQPAPAEAPRPQEPSKAQQQAAPTSIAAPAEAGSDAFGLRAGNGNGIGAPGGTGTCLGTHCGTAGGGGGGLGEGVYRRYLSSALQERVQADERLSRLLFAADLTLSVAPDGRVTGVEFLGAKGRNDEETARRLVAVLAAVRGLDPPPAGMRFPQKVTVRGRRAF